MSVSSAVAPAEVARHRLVVATPALWPAWPFLPLVRRTRGAAELGVLFDARGAVGLTGYSATVFLVNVYDLPPTLPALLASPRDVFDSGDELVAAGWEVD